ncbi:MAG: class 1 isoprenoid biosynthesis enzyme [Pseudobacter sp.]|uniref:class 1 isoprenoid biosynthesis enzyme n=1 Tax=Pseudobacter sp. TaxID=2045420 RepID=UPI003F80C370
MNAGDNAAHSSFPPERPSIGLFRVARHLLSLHAQMKQQEKYCNQEIPRILATIVPPEEFSFSSKEIQRLVKYYQLAVNLVSHNLYQLTGHKTNDREERSMLLLSIFLPLFDDLFDNNILEYHRIESLVSDPENYNPINKVDLVVKQLYLQLLALTPHKQYFIDNLQQGLYWEQQSLKQFDKTTGEEELMQITYNKSYFSILLFCSILEHYPDDAIQRVLYPISGLMQLINDLFDVWKDNQNGLYTIPNLYPDYSKIEKLFLNEVASINEQVSAMPYPVQNRSNYLIRIHALNAMGWMSLQQLKTVTRHKSLSELGRKELVCDLDSLGQQVKWIRHVRMLSNYAAIPQPA